MKRYKYSTLAGIVNKFSNKKIMVVGDLLLDQLIYGEVSRISPEAPVPVVWVKEDDHYRPGGSCNVASNLAAWDTATWDDFFWADTTGAGITKRRKAVNRLGYSAALRIKVATSTQTISFISAHYTIAPGGPL